MPIPERQDGESSDEFMRRCMADDIMRDEYPDAAQRYAVWFMQAEGDGDSDEGD